jgi:hypothetical protein
VKKNVIETIFSLPMEGGKEGEKRPKVIKWFFITYLTLNFYILILITCVILTEIAKLTYLMVINMKEITAQLHWFGHMAFLPFGQNSLENLKTLKVFTPIWGQSRNLVLLCGRLWLYF